MNLRRAWLHSKQRGGQTSKEEYERHIADITNVHLRLLDIFKDQSLSMMMAQNISLYMEKVSVCVLKKLHLIRSEKFKS
jgi:hypothetical protein